MILSILLVAAVAVGIATAALVGFGHRLRRAGLASAVALAGAVAIVSGEVTARLLSLPSRATLVAEATIVAVAIAVGVVRRRWNAIGVTFFATLVTASSAYLALAFLVTVRGGLSPAATATSFAVLGLEALALFIALSYAFENCDVGCRVGHDRDFPLHHPDHQPFVSLHVAAYNEPPEMLIETIRSLEAIDYPHFEIVVVDNNTKDEAVWRPVEAYCAGRENVTFVHVDPWPGFKSGALNLVLREHTDPRAEIIGVVDADYVVRRDYLTRTVGYFADLHLAFVQTPQDYREWKGDTYLTALHDSYAYFFAAAMRSRNERNSIIFGGTMGLIRRSVLEELGGWDEWCITEDAEASLRMLRAGHSGLYLHESFGQGIMPLTFSALKRQRFRWCFGGIQILRKHWRSLLPWDSDRTNHLSLAQRLDYLVGGLQWFIDLVAVGFTVIVAAATALVLLGRPVAFRPLLGPAVLVPVVLGSTGLLRALWALRTLNGIGTRRALFALLTWLSLSWTVALACGKGLVRRDGVFLRTPKWRTGGGLRDALRATTVETTLAAGLWAAAGLAFMAGGSRASLLPVFALWQGGVYAAAPTMAWLNQHTELSARLERRRRTEERRERFGAVQPHLVRGTAAIATFGVVVLLAVGAGNAGDQADVLVLPERSEADRGPLGNVLEDLSGDPDGDEAPMSEPPPTAPATTSQPGATQGPTAPVAGAGGGATVTTSPSPGPTSATTTAPAAVTTTAPTSATSTSTPAPTSTTPPSTTSPPTSAAPPTSASPPTSSSPPSSGPPTSRPGR
ncbi:MAG: glycosyltransferase [Actinobacteria bacterium]|nr:glycosyltransferase [Actinomycetota bacterium]